MRGRWLDYEESGATPGSSNAAAQNTELLNAMLASLHAGVSWTLKAGIEVTFWTAAAAGGHTLRPEQDILAGRRCSATIRSQCDSASGRDAGVPARLDVL